MAVVGPMYSSLHHPFSLKLSPWRPLKGPDQSLQDHLAQISRAVEAQMKL
jgi:hypothetical protein